MLPTVHCPDLRPTTCFAHSLLPDSLRSSCLTDVSHAGSCRGRGVSRMLAPAAPRSREARWDQEWRGLSSSACSSQDTRPASEVERRSRIVRNNCKIQKLELGSVHPGPGGSWDVSLVGLTLKGFGRHGGTGYPNSVTLTVDIHQRTHLVQILLSPSKLLVIIKLSRCAGTNAPRSFSTMPATCYAFKTCLWFLYFKFLFWEYIYIFSFESLIFQKFLF